MEKLEQKTPENQAETEKFPVEEDLDFWTLSFIREHIEMPEIIDFDPDKELDKIKREITKTPKEEQSTKRSLLIAGFKRRLKILRENMTQAQLDLEKIIKSNPDISKEDLLSKVQEIAVKNNVAQLNSYLEVAAQEYLKAHSEILSIINRLSKEHGNNWQDALFRELFGEYPKGEVKIDVMPMNLYFKIGNLEDYALAHGSAPEVARKSGGAQLGRPFPNIPELLNKVLIENSSSLVGPSKKSSNQVKIHEEEHSIHRQLYPPNTFIKISASIDKDLQIEKGADLDTLFFNKCLNRYAHVIALRFQEKAKSEILANLKEMEPIFWIVKIMSDPEELYNYLRDSSDYYTDYFVDHLTKGRQHRVKKQDGTYMTREEIKTAVAEELKKAWEKEYLPILNNALESLQNLFENYKHNPDKYPEITRLLAQEPLKKWPRLVKILT